MLKRSFIASFSYQSNDANKKDLYLSDLSKALGYYLTNISDNVFSYSIEKIDSMECYNAVEDYYLGTIYLRMELSFNSEATDKEIEYILYNEYSFMPSLNNIMPIYFAYEMENKTKLLYKGNLEIKSDSYEFYSHMKNSDLKISEEGSMKIALVSFGGSRLGAYKTNLKINVGDIAYTEGEYQGLAGIVEDIFEYQNQPMMLNIVEAYTE